MLKFPTWCCLALLLGFPIGASGKEPLFSVDVMSAISKAGCNAGTCHGNLNGKGGFRLSLRGQNPIVDFDQLTKTARGRLVNLSAPASSLILKKATGQTPHTGGVRFDSDSSEYADILHWIQNGAQGPRASSKRLTALEVTPKSAVVLAPDSTVQISVFATFDDGEQRDVTSRACYELSNLNAEVSPLGLVTRLKFGETTLIVRYLDKQIPVQIGFRDAHPDYAWSHPSPRNFIDTHVFSKLRALKINLSPACSDDVFVRRAYLDGIGRIPTANETRAFLNDENPLKRTILIDQLLERPEFADYWAIKFADILRVEEKVLDPKGVEIFHEWIRECIQSAMPLDEMVRQLVTGTGSTFSQPAANYYRAKP